VAIKYVGSCYRKWYHGYMTKTKVLDVLGNRWLLLGLGLIIGAVAVLSLRFFSYKVDGIHYHANFGLYINGQKEDFKNPLYYSETGMCTLSKVMTPATRAHMHDNIDDVIHVEDHAVTWGNFFTGLGWYMGPNFIVSSDGTMYSEASGNKLNLVLNNQNYTDLGGLANTVIKDKDRLLVSYGPADETRLKQQYQTVPSNAAQYDVAKDPKSCSGHDSPTMHDRFTHMF
jgi:hypothetical protein